MHCIIIKITNCQRDQKFQALSVTALLGSIYYPVESTTREKPVHKSYQFQLDVKGLCDMYVNVTTSTPE